jgi:class 3 adenylate cyclase
MALKDDVASDLDRILTQPWHDRDGMVVPSTSDVALSGGGVHLDVTVLYSDLADSTELVMEHDRRTAAKVMNCFLACCTRIIKAHGGDIRSFDGDRVMGIYIGSSKNSNAAKTALTIKWAFNNLLKPKIHNKYTSIKNGTYKLNYATGIDTSSVLAVRGGIRGSNDLIWVGRAPNVAAKLSNIREAPYQSYITADVYKMLSNETRYATKDGNKIDMWEARSHSALPGITLYRSSYHWAL